MGSVTNLALGNFNTVIPTLLKHGLTESLGTICIRALTDCQVAVVLVEVDVLIKRCHSGFNLELSKPSWLAANSINHGLEVGGCGSAAATNQGEAKLSNKLLVRGCQLIRSQRVVSAIAGENWEASVWHNHHRYLGMLGELPQVLAHLGRTSGAVEADHVDTEWLECG